VIDECFLLPLLQQYKNERFDMAVLKWLGPMELLQFASAAHVTRAIVCRGLIQLCEGMLAAMPWMSGHQLALPSCTITPPLISVLCGLVQACRARIFSTNNQILPNATSSVKKSLSYVYDEETHSVAALTALPILRCKRPVVEECVRRRTKRYVKAYGYDGSYHEEEDLDLLRGSDFHRLDMRPAAGSTPLGELYLLQPNRLIRLLNNERFSVFTLDHTLPVLDFYEIRRAFERYDEVCKITLFPLFWAEKWRPIFDRRLVALLKQQQQQQQQQQK
jgi:hypothetical protein